MTSNPGSAPGVCPDCGVPLGRLVGLLDTYESRVCTLCAEEKRERQLTANHATVVAMVHATEAQIRNAPWDTGACCKTTRRSAFEEAIRECEAMAVEQVSELRAQALRHAADRLRAKAKGDTNG